ncbi:hypothetical protein CRUP_026891 [Coryphaenoides rupestris]|nr:hypothetical protein CRUP_026891 [Coryphaenoides rupestris]
MTIKRLSADVQSKLRSGVAVGSLQQAVEELVLNSVDAGATCVCVRMDTAAFRVQVVDNGSGMDAADLERVGNRYCTSKCGSVEDLDKLEFYGFRGEALASLASLATLVEISSRTKLSVKTHAKVFRNGEGSAVFEAETPRPSAGTTLTVCNLFHNMPVRRNRMDSVVGAERVRQRVEAISLMHPSVSFTLKSDVTGAMLTQLPKARNTHHRFVQIHGLGRAQHLREVYVNKVTGLSRYEDPALGEAQACCTSDITSMAVNVVSETDSYEDDPDAPGERRLCSSTITPPLELSVTEEELRLLRGCQSPLRSLGLQLELPQTGAPRVLVGKVPLCFTEKEHNEVRRGRPSVIKPVVEEYLREQIEIFCSTGSVRGTLPLTVLKVLASLACHGAIKFNDVLSRDECHSLVGSLSACQLPFQCAHGRPSIAPLVDTLYLDSGEKAI